MISVKEAKKLIRDNVHKRDSVNLLLHDALHMVVSSDVLSPVDLPLFAQSAMDGYAVCTDPVHLSKFELVGQVKAGDSHTYQLLPGQAIRIFTGAAVPNMANGILIQEKALVSGNEIIATEPVVSGRHIRKQGSQLTKGSIAFKAGTTLNPATTGLLASMGVTHVPVYSKPLVSLISTVDELREAGTVLNPGEIYESNTIMLRAALQQMNINACSVLSATDDREQITSVIEKSINESDLTIITGGISVGEFDYVHQVLETLGVETVFYKVAQKPGKPLFAGRHKDKWVFALPGNPASALVCFYEYVYPTIQIMMGLSQPWLPAKNVKLLKALNCSEPRAEFVRAVVSQEGAMPLGGQDSGMLHSFAMANALIYIAGGNSRIEENEIVEVHLLPFANQYIL